MEANELMSDAVYVVSPHDSIAQARNLFIRHKISTVLVVDGGKPVGMIDEQSLTDAFLKSREPVDSIRVEKVMKHTIVKVGPAASAEEVAKALVQKNAHAAIVYDKEVLGIITKTDLTRHFAKN